MMQTLIAFLMLVAGEALVCWLLFKGRAMHAMIIALCVLLLVSTQAFAQETVKNLPVQCVGVSTDLTGKPISDCPGSNQKFLRANAESWVRNCDPVDIVAPATTCVYKTMKWQRFGAPGNTKIEVCTVNKATGSPAAGTGASCSTSGTGWSGMKQVSTYDVAVVPPLPPTSAFTATPAKGSSPLDIVLAWNVPNMPQGTPCQAQSTTATGAAGPWSGPKAAVSSEELKSLMQSTRFTLTCVWSKDIAVVVAWTPPTMNTDGSPLTGIESYTVQYGESPQAMSQSANAAANVSSLLIKDYYFKAGTWYFSMRTNAGGNQSDPSNVVALALVKPPSQAEPFSGTVDVVINAKPLPPSDVTAHQADEPHNTQQIVDEPTPTKQEKKPKEKPQ